MLTIEEVTMYAVYSASGDCLKIFEEEWEAEDYIREYEEESADYEAMRNERW